jgi:hypothetical protein
MLKYKNFFKFFDKTKQIKFIENFMNTINSVRVI